MAEINPKNKLDLLGQNIRIVPKWKEGFWEGLTTRGMVKTRMDQNQRIAQNQKDFFLEETKSKKRF